MLAKERTNIHLDIIYHFYMRKISNKTMKRKNKKSTTYTIVLKSIIVTLSIRRDLVRHVDRSIDLIMYSLCSSDKIYCRYMCYLFCLN